MVSRRISPFKSRKTADKHERATANSAFFTVLPPEVRTSILIAAFGRRTVHIERCNPEPLQKQMEAEGYIPPLGTLGTAKQWLGGLVTKVKAKTLVRHPTGRRTQWCGLICSRLPDQAPFEDACLGHLWERMRAARCACASSPELAVGALGWLLTCRKAYNEGVEILYSTNTFVVRPTSHRVFGGLFPRIPANILSRITSAEFIFEEQFISSKDYDSLPETDKDEVSMLTRTLSSVPERMQNLQKLYIGFYPDTCLLDDCRFGRALEYRCTKYIASLMGAMARELGKMGKSCDIELGLPYTPFSQYRHEAVTQSCRIGIPEWKQGMPKQFSYYPRPRVFRPAHDERPNAESGVDDGAGPDVGYWISETLFDERSHFKEFSFET